LKVERTVEHFCAACAILSLEADAKSIAELLAKLRA
jgi:hypothetical protein